MMHRRTLRWFMSLALLAGLLLAALPASDVAADGIGDAVIGSEYGATRALDGAGNDAANGDSESCPVPDGNRGNLMELHAYSAPAANGDNQWHFAFVVDSSQPLNSTTSSFFGKGDSMTVGYFLGIDVGCNGGPAGDMNATTPWKRFFSWQGATYNGANPGVDYVIAMDPGIGNPNTIQAELLSMSGGVKTLVQPNIPTTTRVVDYRRHVELWLDPTLANMPADLKTNSQLCLALVSTENSNDVNGNGGRVLDDLGNGGAVTGCDLRYRLDNTGVNGPMPVKIDTQAFCQVNGRPMPGGSATRHCTSFPARTLVNAVDTGLACTNSIPGVAIDGNIEAAYDLLTEAEFAAPYQGGDPAHSDFGGESSAYSYWTGSAMATYADSGNADVRDVHVQTDSQFLYLNVSGPGLTAFGGLGQMNGQPADNANLFIAVDVPDIASTTDRGDHGGGPEVYTPPHAAAGSDASNHPGSRPVNFRGWAPDFIVELIWAGDDGTTGNAQLWRWDNSSATWNLTVPYQFTTVETAVTSPSGNLPFNTNWFVNNNTSPTAASLYFGRQPTSYEFALPWAALGGKPALQDAIKIGVYTTRNDDGWDINDQAPGIGEGSNGLGAHERVGDLADENDNESDPAAAGNDLTPYAGRSHGQNNRAPGSDNTAGDSDTIEAYFTFRQDPELFNCPLTVALASLSAAQQADAVLVTWETATELDNLGFNLYRATSPAGPEVQLNAALIPSQAPGSTAGFTYTWEDRSGLAAGQTYYYWLEDVDLSGATTLHGPVSVDFAGPTAVTLVGLQVDARAGGATVWLAAAGLAALAGATLWQRRRLL